MTPSTTTGLSGPLNSTNQHPHPAAAASLRMYSCGFGRLSTEVHPHSYRMNGVSFTVGPCLAYFRHDGDTTVCQCLAVHH